MKKQYNNTGVDWLEVVIPPEDPEDGAEYTIRVHLTWLMSNWQCVFGNGCPGMFPKNSSTYKDDAGCCTDSFYFNNHDEIDFVATQMARLTDDDWDKDRRAYVEKHGYVKTLKKGKTVTDEDGEEALEGWSAKGKVFEGACVFQNRNDGSAGKPGCAFHWLAQRTGESHTEVMPHVCWQLPIRFGETEDGSNVYELRPWDTAQWFPDEYEFNDNSMSHHWWCIDVPDAYVGSDPVYKTLEEELTKTLGERDWSFVKAAIDERLALGNTYPPMPGAVLNEGRSLLPLFVGNRTPSREPSYLPAHIERLKADERGEGSSID